MIFRLSTNEHMLYVNFKHHIFLLSRKLPLMAISVSYPNRLARGQVPRFAAENWACICPCDLPKVTARTF